MKVLVFSLLILALVVVATASRDGSRSRGRDHERRRQEERDREEYGDGNSGDGSEEDSGDAPGEDSENSSQYSSENNKNNDNGSRRRSGGSRYNRDYNKGRGRGRGEERRNMSNCSRMNNFRNRSMSYPSAVLMKDGVRCFQNFFTSNWALALEVSFIPKKNASKNSRYSSFRMRWTNPTLFKSLNFTIHQNWISTSFNKQIPNSYIFSMDIAGKDENYCKILAGKLTKEPLLAALLTVDIKCGCNKSRTSMAGVNSQPLKVES